MFVNIRLQMNRETDCRYDQEKSTATCFRAGVETIDVGYYLWTQDAKPKQARRKEMYVRAVVIMSSRLDARMTG